MIIIHYWAVLGAAVAAFAFGAIWFTPLFGKTYQRYVHSLEGATDRGPRYSAATAMVVKFLGVLVEMYVIAILLALAAPATWMEAAAFGFMIAGGLSAITGMSDVVFERKPFRIYAVQAGYEIIAAMIGAVVLFYW